MIREASAARRSPTEENRGCADRACFRYFTAFSKTNVYTAESRDGEEASRIRLFNLRKRLWRNGMMARLRKVSARTWCCLLVIGVAGGCGDAEQATGDGAQKIEYVRNSPKSSAPEVHESKAPFAGANHLHPVPGETTLDGQVRPADFSWQNTGPELPRHGSQKLNVADAWNADLRRSAIPGRPAESLYPSDSSSQSATYGPPTQIQNGTNTANNSASVSTAGGPALFSPPPPWPRSDSSDTPTVSNSASIASSNSNTASREPPPPETYGPYLNLDSPEANTGSTGDNAAETMTPRRYPQAGTESANPQTTQQDLPWQNSAWEQRPRGQQSTVQLPPAVARRTEELTQRAFDLAGRGATYSARQELIRALEVVAESLDAAEQSSQHRRALAAAFRALDEAVDFAPRGTTLLHEIDIKTVVSGHLTDVVRNAGVNLKDISAIECSRAYYTFAQEQLAFACGSQQPASLALYGLGKLNATFVESGVDRLDDAATRSIVFHQAAVSVDAGNWRAANELAVQLAASARYEEARSWLQHATQLSDAPELWSNLAVVHSHLGEERLAREATARSERLAQRLSPSAGKYNVQWLPPAAFTGAPQGQ